MNAQRQLNLLLIVIVGLVIDRAAAETIFSIHSSLDQGYGCVAIFTGQGYRIGWTQTDGYDSVTITARLSSNGQNNQTGRAYLTAQIGPGTSLSNQVAWSSFEFPVDLEDVTLFQGLQLAPGRYYLSIIGDSTNWASCWAGATTNYIAAPGVLSLGAFGQGPGGMSNYFPATPIYQEQSLHVDVTMQGVNTSHPVLQVDSSGSIVLLSWSTNLLGFQLEAAGTPATSNWAVVTQAPIIVADRYVFATNAVGARFFRLARHTN